MKKAAFAFICSLTFFIGHGQSKMIEQIFRLLPASKVYDLNLAIRDSMLQGKTYYPADNDSLEIMAYNLGYSPEVSNYVFISFSFETQQRGSGMIEIRSFKMESGDNLIFVSKIGGVWDVGYEQHDLSTFIYGKDKKLVPYKKKILPPTDEKIFMKQGIPDSIKNIIRHNANLIFNLSTEKITLAINSNYLSGNKAIRKWLKGDRVYYDWIKDHFVISKMDFEFDADEE